MGWGTAFSLEPLRGALEVVGTGLSETQLGGPRSRVVESIPSSSSIAGREFPADGNFGGLVVDCATTEAVATMNVGASKNASMVLRHDVLATLVRIRTGRW